MIKDVIMGKIIPLPGRGGRSGKSHLRAGRVAALSSV
jgi:hypothetical protein